MTPAARRAQQLRASPTNFCWWCSRKLLPKPGGGYRFSVAEGHDGNLHRVHKECARDMLEDEQCKRHPDDPR